MAGVRLLWPLIQTALGGGHSLKQVCERLNEDDFAMNYRTLSTCVGVAKGRTSAVCGCSEAPRMAIGHPIDSRGHTCFSGINSQESQRDSLANLRKYGTDRLFGLHFNSLSDSEELF